MNDSRWGPNDWGGGPAPASGPSPSRRREGRRARVSTLSCARPRPLDLPSCASTHLRAVRLRLSLSVRRASGTSRSRDTAHARPGTSSSRHGSRAACRAGAVAGVGRMGSNVVMAHGHGVHSTPGLTTDHSPHIALQSNCARERAVLKPEAPRARYTIPLRNHSARAVAPRLCKREATLPHDCDRPRCDQSAISSVLGARPPLIPE